MINHRMSIAGIYEIQLKDYQDWIKQCIETFKGFEEKVNEQVLNLEKSIEDWISSDQFNKIKRFAKDINIEIDS